MDNSFMQLLRDMGAGLLTQESQRKEARGKSALAIGARAAMEKSGKPPTLEEIATELANMQARLTMLKQQVHQVIQSTHDHEYFALLIQHWNDERCAKLSPEIRHLVDKVKHSTAEIIANRNCILAQTPDCALEVQCMMSEKESDQREYLSWKKARREWVDATFKTLALNSLEPVVKAFIMPDPIKEELCATIEMVRMEKYMNVYEVLCEISTWVQSIERAVVSTHAPQ